ncbi:MAG: serine/threonine-protein kinase, partial [Ilumatobacteraceae bacterium]
MAASDTSLPPPRPVTARVGTGTLLGERYRLDHRLATGGMGEVWSATDTVLLREVAVKILKDELVDFEDFLERFRAEARHTAALTHHGIARVFDYGEQLTERRCTAFLVMELVRGAPLSDVLAKEPVMSLDAALSILAQTSDALHAAHQLGVVHRDVKPGNLLLLDDYTVKVTDFGIARAVNSVPVTRAGQVIGTAAYMSPEQAAGGDATASSDLYSLGVIGYEMLAGRRPFSADNPAAL